MPSRRGQKTLRNLYFAFILSLLLILLWPLAGGSQPFELGLDLSGGAMVTYRPDFDQVPQRFTDLPKPDLLEMAKETLTGRLLHRFETLPDIVVRGDGRLVVSLPGEHDQRRVLEVLGRTYRLGFRPALASHASPPEEVQGLLRPYAGRWLDLGEELLSGEDLDPDSIRVDLGQGGLEGLGQGAGVSFEFAPPHDETFAEMTRELVGETLAILLDDEVEWAGSVQEQIRGPGVLRGGYTVEQATEVAGLLRAGNLPISLDIESLSAVGPTLGQEILGRGQLALGWSVLLLVTLLVLAYGRRPPLLVAGLSSLGLLLLTTLGLIAGLGLTVDLVAIAGLVLSIGMGMDAFILIFEAMEGERSASGAPAGALPRLRHLYSFAGEGRTLFHANATTLLVVLLLLGSQRLKSFALFLLVGLAASLLTILATRHLLTFFARRGGLERGSHRGPLAALRLARPGLFRLRWLYTLGLLAFFVATGLQLAQRPGPWLELGADFQPGLQLRVSLEEGRNVESLVEDLRGHFPGVQVRHQALSPTAEGEVDSAGTGGHLITLEGREWQEAEWSAETSGDQAGAPTPERLSSWLEEQGVRVDGLHSIDARLSSHRTFMSLGVLVFSFALLGLYLGWGLPRLDRRLRAEPDDDPADALNRSVGRMVFAGTVAAVTLDLLAVLAALAWLQIPIAMPVIAALLTIVGYSVNDSMVLACHLTDPARDPDIGPEARLRMGVDRILSRALLTSLSTVMPALAILAAGLEPLRGFAWAILVGTVAGTLSSMFVVASFARHHLVRG